MLLVQVLRGCGLYISTVARSRNDWDVRRQSIRIELLRVGAHPVDLSKYGSRCVGDIE